MHSCIAVYSHLTLKRQWGWLDRCGRLSANPVVYNSNLEESSEKFANGIFRKRKLRPDPGVLSGVQLYKVVKPWQLYLIQRLSSKCRCNDLTWKQAAKTILSRNQVGSCIHQTNKNGVCLRQYLGNAAREMPQYLTAMIIPKKQKPSTDVYLKFSFTYASYFRVWIKGVLHLVGNATISALHNTVSCRNDHILVVRTIEKSILWTCMDAWILFWKKVSFFT